MEIIDIIRELLSSEIVDKFDIVRFENTAEWFDIWFDKTDPSKGVPKEFTAFAEDHLS